MSGGSSAAVAAAPREQAVGRRQAAIPRSQTSHVFARLALFCTPSIPNDGDRVDDSQLCLCQISVPLPLVPDDEDFLDVNFALDVRCTGEDTLSVTSRDLQLDPHFPGDRRRAAAATTIANKCCCRCRRCRDRGCCDRGEWAPSTSRLLPPALLMPTSRVAPALLCSRRPACRHLPGGVPRSRRQGHPACEDAARAGGRAAGQARSRASAAAGCENLEWRGSPPGLPCLYIRTPAPQPACYITPRRSTGAQAASGGTQGDGKGPRQVDAGGHLRVPGALPPFSWPPCKANYNVCQCKASKQLRACQLRSWLACRHGRVRAGLTLAVPCVLD